MSNGAPFLGYEALLDNTVRRDEAILQEKNENANAINEGLSEGIIKSRLKERCPGAEILSFPFASEEVEEIIRTVSYLKNAFNSVKNPFDPSVIFPFQAIELKVSEITEEAKNFLIADNLASDIIGEILDKIGDILVDRRHIIKLYVSRDKEIEDWKELVFSVEIEEEDFGKIIKLWDEVEEEAEKVIDAMKAKAWAVMHIEKIKKILSIEVRRLKNV